MRSDSAAFYSANIQKVAVPVVVVELSFATSNDDLFYLTSHANVDCPGIPIGLQYDTNFLWYDGGAEGELLLYTTGPRHFQNSIRSASTTSQKLDIANFASTIGAINIECLDDGTLSDYFRQKLAQGKTTSKNRLRVYVGFEGMSFAEMSLVQTQVVKDVSYNNGLMRINCLDIQRETKKTIFDPKSTTMTANIDADDTTVSVNSTLGFQAVWHGPSYTAEPNQDVGYLLVGDVDNEYEVIAYTGKTANTFTGCIRGAFGTIPKQWHALDSEGESNELEVQEFIYLELPAAKLAYAILTGTLYGDAGKHLPDHWHLGIDEQWISTSRFTTIGNDIWDITDDEKGIICYFAGLDKEDGRKFINSELMPLIGCFMPITVTGELGLKRISSVISGAPYVVELNERNVKDVDGIRYAQNEIINNIRVDWSYDYVKDDFRRSSIFIDSSSSAIYGLRAERLVELSGLHGTRHSRDSIRAMFNSIRDRFSGEPLYTSVDLHPSLNVLEVGDIVRLNLSDWPDYTNASNIDRSFEVQGVTINWLRGDVSVDLFGSSRKGAPLSDDGEGYSDDTAFADALLTSEGTDIEVTYAANVSRSGDLVTINSGFTFAGADALTQSDGTPNPSCILFCDGDLLIPSGVTLTITKNVILVVTGFLTINGAIDGAGNGPVGGDYRRTYLDQELNVVIDPVFFLGKTAVAYVNASLGYDAPSAGFLHPVLVGQGGCFLIDYPLKSAAYSYDEEGRATYAWNPATYQIEASNYTGDTSGEHSIAQISEYSSIPVIEIGLTDLFGLPSTLQGGSGPAGRHLFTVTMLVDGATATAVAHGTSGGAGGAGLVTISRGMEFGVNGYIDLSGDDAVLTPQSYTLRGETFWAGVGCGGTPGCWLCFIDGADNVAPIIEASNFIANFGLGTSYGTPDTLGIEWGNLGTLLDQSNRSFPGNNHASTRVSTTHNISGNYFEQYSRVQYVVAGTAAPGEPTEADTTVGNPGTPVLTENTNTPPTPAGNLSSIDVYVPPPSPSDYYSYSIVEWRYSSQSAWNTVPQVAQDEVSISGLVADGSSIIVRARAVSTSGKENASGPTQSITLSTVGTAAYIADTSYDSVSNTALRVIKASDSSVVPLKVAADTGVVTIGEDVAAIQYNPATGETTTGEDVLVSGVANANTNDISIIETKSVEDFYSSYETVDVNMVISFTLGRIKHTSGVGTAADQYKSRVYSLNDEYAISLPSWSKSRSFSAKIYVSSIIDTNTEFAVATGQALYAAGETELYGFGFIFDGADETIYACAGNASSQSRVDTGVTFTTSGSYSLYAKYIQSTGDIVFYIDDVLVATISSIVPGGSVSRNFLFSTWIYTDATTSWSGDIYVGEWRFWQSA